jgi:hypothetical protein
LAVDGETVSIVTLPGETAAEIAVKMAAAITDDAVLSGLGVVAQADGDGVVVAGAITAITISDPGLAHAVPLSGWFAPVVALLLLVSGFFWINTSQRGRNGGPISQ